ncbi:MAG: PIG-L family deacetylase [Thermoflexales bacterium]|nr:PIG-L family deacetylase [Thermoflexales bacterium]MDW8351998.1 PIG-L family deacetylase [Anaerolineae bacterium]
MILFVSPHLDDVALSCGGFVYRLASAGQPVTIATVCTADHPTDWPLSEAAQHEHRQWQLGDRPYQGRRAEDERACRVLGASPVHLNLLDAIYRRDACGAPLYTNDFIGGAVHPRDWEVQLPAAQAVLAPLVRAATRVFCPLAIGGHVDHVIVRRAVESLATIPALRYYEDFPYADRPEQFTPQGCASERITLTAHELDARIRAIACYGSQLSAVFGSPEAMPGRVRGYVSRVGGERYWFVVDSVASHE